MGSEVGADALSQELRVLGSLALSRVPHSFIVSFLPQSPFAPSLSLILELGSLPLLPPSPTLTPATR